MRLICEILEAMVKPGMFILRLCATTTATVGSLAILLYHGVTWWTVAQCLSGFGISLFIIWGPRP